MGTKSSTTSEQWSLRVNTWNNKVLVYIAVRWHWTLVVLIHSKLFINLKTPLDRYDPNWFSKQASVGLKQSLSWTLVGQVLSLKLWMFINLPQHKISNSSPQSRRAEHEAELDILPLSEETEFVSQMCACVCGEKSLSEREMARDLLTTLQFSEDIFVLSNCATLSP